MLESRIARGLMFLGASVGILSVVVAALDMRVTCLTGWFGSQ